MAIFSFSSPASDERSQGVAHAPPRAWRGGPPDDNGPDESANVVVSGGPGWYESSSDLLRGLEVREELTGDASLYEWLGIHLRA